MNEQSQAKSPEALRAMVAGPLANFQHPTLKHNLTTLKALHHVAWMDDTLHVELVMPFVWHSAFEELSGRGESRHSGRRYLRPINPYHAGRRKSASNFAGRYPYGTDYVSWPGN